MAFEPPKILVNGRRAVDYATLKELWADSGMKPREFLATYGLKWTSGKVRQVAKDWLDGLNRSVPGDNTEIKIHTKPIEHADVWSTFKKWRIMQGQEDYQTAAALRQHVKIRLNQALRKKDNGEVFSSLMPRDVDAISRTLLNIQKIQRLALGMSTENVGVPNTDQLQLDNEIIEATGTDDIPTFIVEVNKNGKFVRPKPRQVSAAGTAPRTAKTS
mgnify:CR=1 FL=1